jgi:hypothetical protein
MGRGTLKKPSITSTYSLLRLSVHSHGSKLISCFIVNSNVVCKEHMPKTIKRDKRIKEKKENIRRRGPDKISIVLAN